MRERRDQVLALAACWASLRAVLVLVRVWATCKRRPASPKREDLELYFLEECLGHLDRAVWTAAGCGRARERERTRVGASVDPVLLALSTTDGAHCNSATAVPHEVPRDAARRAKDKSVGSVPSDVELVGCVSNVVSGKFGDPVMAPSTSRKSADGARSSSSAPPSSPSTVPFKRWWASISCFGGIGIRDDDEEEERSLLLGD